jgi:trk system potassium uptake protein TrkA
MRIIIVGGGLTGTQLARHLAREKHDVSLVESNEERARHLANRLDCLVLHDEGNSLRVLEEAGIAKADALVCVTESDEVNMIICGIAECRYPKLLKIARVHNDDYVRLNRHDKDGKAGSFIFQTPQILGIDYFVHPDVEAARAALDAIEHGALGDVLSFAGTDYKLGAIEVAKGSRFDGLALKAYRDLVPGESLITMIERDDKSILPDGNAVLKSGDRIYILAMEDQLNQIYRLGGSEEQALHKIGIAGGSQSGILIAETLAGADSNHSMATQGFAQKTKSFISRFKGIIRKTNRSIILIENDYKLCKELASRFPKLLVLNEDISDENFVAEDRLDNLDLIVTCSPSQEFNIITALYLKARGVKRAIAFVSGDGYAAIGRKLGVDVVIPMQSVVVDAILSRLSGGGLKGVHRMGNAVGIFEIEISAETPVAGKSICDFRLSKGGLVMLANREDEGKQISFIPKGDYIFKAGDHIILIAKNGSEKEIENFFGVAL